MNRTWAWQLSLILLLAIVWLFPVGHSIGVEAQNPCNGPAVCDLTVQSASRSPGESTSYEVTFITPSNIDAIAGVIVMEVDDSVAFPGYINPSTVRVQYRTSDESGNGVASDVELNHEQGGGDTTTIRIYHRLRKGNAQLSIPTGSKVSIVFSREAGIVNPHVGGAFSWLVGVGGSNNLANATHPNAELREAFRRASHEAEDEGLLVDRQIQLSSDEISRGQSLTVRASGYDAGHTLTVWRDANINGKREDSEGVLCEAVVGNNGRAQCSFTVSSPPFVGAFGQCLNEFSFNCNFINAEVSSSGSTTIIGRGSADIYDSNQILKLVGRIKVTSVEGPGGRIGLQLVDFPEGVLSAVVIGGVPAEIDPIVVGPSGTLFFSVQVPDSVRLGRQYLKVELKRQDTGEKYSQEDIINIAKPYTVVRSNPESVLANQRISLSGLGFSKAKGMTIDRLDIDGMAVEPSRIDEGMGSIEVAADGSWAGTLDLPILETTTIPGQHTLRVTDGRGRTGSVEVVVPPRKLTVSPVWGRPGQIVTVRGQGFPSRNVFGSSVVIRIYYHSSDWFNVVSTETDAHGNFSADIQVPLKTASPSSNLVTVEFGDDNGVKVITEARHEIAAATIQLSPESGPPGSSISMKGTGFRNFSRVQSIMFSGIEVAPYSEVWTDARGEFTVDLLIPGLPVGQHTVQARVTGVTSTTTCYIAIPNVIRGAPVSANEAFTSLGEKLLTVFHFSNLTKNWSFFDPLLEDFNSLEVITSGEVYLIQVKETVEVELNGKHRRLNCHQGNCWNQIVW